VALPKAGEALLRQVKPSLDQLAGADSVVAERQARSGGRARISESAVAMELLVAPVLADFRRAHPDFLLEIIAEDRLSDPAAQRYDAVIRRAANCWSRT
jgi:DNA-binding transcriptional LysR family regulator